MLTGEPFIPETITVHLGSPNEDAQDVTIAFSDYVKSVASSEIYPTWPEASLRANIYVITTFALNRIYTEWYRARGYAFDITSSTQYDQKYIYGREVFENISRLVDEQFFVYIRRTGTVEPLFTAFCNGTTVTCEGLSQWGTVDLAQQEMGAYDILTYYYGTDIELVRDAPIQSATPSYPGFPLALGYAGNDVRTIQVQLNRISHNYPAIPKIGDVNGDFDYYTQDAVIAFQEIFQLNPTGVIDEATWYKISYIFTSVKHLAELDSEGLALEDVANQHTETLRLGMQGDDVRYLQYYLAVVGAYYAKVRPVEITGFYGAETEASVNSFQQVFGLPQTGVVDRRTFYDLYHAYLGIVDSMPISENTKEIVLFPGVILREGITSEYVRILQQYLSYIHNTYPEVGAVNATGYFGPMTKQSVMAFQQLYELPVNGIVGAITWNEIAGLYSQLLFGFDKRPYQAPGYTIQ